MQRSMRRERLDVVRMGDVVIGNGDDEVVLRPEPSLLHQLLHLGLS